MCLAIYYNNKKQRAVEDKPTVSSVAKNYLKTRSGIQNMIVRPVIHSLKLTQLVLTAFASSVQGPRELFRLADHLLYWVGYPSRIKNLDRSIRKFYDGCTSGSLRKMMSKTIKLYVSTTLCTGLIADGIKNLEAREVITLSPSQIQILSQIRFLSGIGFLLVSARGIQAQCRELLKNPIWSEQFNLALIKLIGNVALAVIAIFSLLSYTFTTIFSPWTTLGLSVTLLISSVGGHFYEKIYFPEKPKT